MSGRPIPDHVKIYPVSKYGNLLPYMLTTKLKHKDGSRRLFVISDVDFQYIQDEWGTGRCYAFYLKERAWVKISVYRYWVTGYTLIEDEELIKEIEEDLEYEENS